MKNDSKFKELFHDMIEQIQKKVPLKAVILFGSHAKGDAHQFSDYDLVIIADFQESYLNRALWVVHLAPEVSVDVFCYTPAEFETLFNSYNLTAIDAISEGIPLYGEKFIAPYKEKYQEFVRRGLRKKKWVLIPPSPLT